VAYGADMADLVYPPVIGLGHAVFFALGIQFTVEGTENIPRSGGAVLACNHVSYLDFTFIGLTALPSKRYVRFMAKDQTFKHPVSGPLMRGMHHIPVDRSAGAAAFDHGVTALRRGEIVGIFPEATISRSYTPKAFKTGAARMAAAADVPLIPMATWGGQRLYTKARKPDLHRGKAVMLAVGEPFRPAPGEDAATTTAELCRRVSALLDRLQRTYPQAPSSGTDSWWLPAHLGGTAPTLEEADALDVAEQAAKKRT
jgi:1-acyl-sn-glycerol-3-phosphate acyltransferase